MDLWELLRGIDWGSLFDYGLKALAALIAWLLVILGWAVANDLASQRERRKVEENKLEALRQSLTEIEELARIHHSGPFDEARFRSIARKTKLVGFECSHLERSRILGAEWRQLNYALRRAVTLKNFERAVHSAQTSTSAVLYEIEEAFDKFQIYLMRALESKAEESEPLRATLKRIVRRI